VISRELSRQFSGRVFFFRIPQWGVANPEWTEAPWKQSQWVKDGTHIKRASSPGFSYREVGEMAESRGSLDEGAQRDSISSLKVLSFNIW